MCHLTHTAEYLGLHLNHFEGMVPDAICDLNITNFKADCYEELINHTTEVTCRCCTTCCNWKDTCYLTEYLVPVAPTSAPTVAPTAAPPTAAPSSI